MEQTREQFIENITNWSCFQIKNIGDCREPTIDDFVDNKLNPIIGILYEAGLLYEEKVTDEEKETIRENLKRRFKNYRL